MENNNNTVSNAQIEESLLDDGQGHTHSRYCGECGNRSIYIAKPNDFRCRNCYKENWVVVPLEDVLASNS